ncbi:hypothetical protein BDV06DRAFT_211633 [Aspergillus oleicola]
MSDELPGRPSEVEYLETMKESEISVIFKVRFRANTCVMKVVRMTSRLSTTPPNREVNPLVCESIAYARLKAEGLCGKGVVPEFYGMIRNIQPAKWAFLDMFVDDISPPNAILIEYIPNLHQIDLSNFSKPRLTKLRRILDKVHEAEQGGQERVFWIDFGSAQELPAQGSRTPKQERRLRHEIELVDYFVDALEGKLNSTVSYYYEWFV